jgi:hypothetical protein
LMETAVGYVWYIIRYIISINAINASFDMQQIMNRFYAPYVTICLTCLPHKAFQFNPSLFVTTNATHAIRAYQNQPTHLIMLSTVHYSVSTYFKIVP